MASPQKEDGYVPIAGELLQAVAKARLPASERAVFDCVSRFSYGYRTKKAKISVERFIDWTGYSRSHIKRTIGILIAKNMLTQDPSSRPASYSIQKNYDLWLTGIGQRDEWSLTGKSSVPQMDLSSVHDDGPLPEGAMDPLKVHQMDPLKVHDDGPPLINKTRNKEKPCGNYLTPFLDLAEKIQKWHPAPGKLAAALKPLRDEHGNEEVLARWGVYLKRQKDWEFLSAPWFASHFDRFAPEVQRRVKVDKQLDRAKPPLIAERNAEMKKLDANITGDFLEDLRRHSPEKQELAERIAKRLRGDAA